MKPVVDFKRCFASKQVCTAIKCCPVKAVSYIEVDEPILDKFLNCNCNDPNRTGKIPVACTDSGCGCGVSGCGDENGEYNVNSCGGSPYGRIIIDYNKCTRCGLCVKECCGTAIGLYPEDCKIEPIKGKPKCGCEGGCC
jgi:hypothetical protein